MLNIKFFAGKSLLICGLVMPLNGATEWQKLRQMEKLLRGVVAVNQGGGKVFVLIRPWRGFSNPAMLTQLDEQFGGQSSFVARRDVRFDVSNFSHSGNDRAH
jgi:hypothetical protein